METTFQLKDYIDLHKEYEHLSEIPKHLFDGYLLEVSPTYRNIRALCTKLGFQFDECNGSFSLNYRINPLLHLDQVLKLKLLPYVDSTTTYEDLLQENPNYKLRLDFWSFGSYFNYSLLHEQAHAISESLIDSSNKALKVYACEAFANLVECLCYLEIVNEKNYVVILNSFYVKLLTYDKIVQFKELSKDTDSKTLFSKLFVRYFYLHHGEQNLANKCGRLIQSPNPSLELDEFMDENIFVTEQFRQMTTGQYFTNKENITNLSSVSLAQLLEVADNLYSQLYI